VAKKGIRNIISYSLTWQINIPTPPAGIHEYPGLHLSHTRMSGSFTSESRVAFLTVFGKRKAGLDERRSRFNIFCTYF
jgi:hypothetical protein